MQHALVRGRHHGIGSADFAGTNTIPAPWDSVVVAVIALAAWLAGVRAGQRYLAEHPAPAPPAAEPAAAPAQPVTRRPESGR